MKSPQAIQKRKEYKTMTIDITNIILSVLTLLGACGWFVSGKKHRQEVESLKADNRQKDMNRRTSERRG